MHTPRLLLLLGQSPFDPASGAAQSMRQWAELLATCGWEVRALSTRGCEAASTDPLQGLQPPDGNTGRVRASFSRADVQLTELQHAGVAHQILHSDPTRARHWEHDLGGVYNDHLQQLLHDFAPDLLFTFGDDPGDRSRRALAQSLGVRVLFGLHNLAYRERPPHCDHFLAPTDFLAARYRARWPGGEIEVLPTVLMPASVVASQHDPVFVTFVNPEPAKGAALVARLAARLGRERPDIPLLVVEGRATATDLLQVAQEAGLALERYPNVLFTPATPHVQEIWAHCRILLMPSLVEEAAGRCALEAMANGAVPVVSDRGALPGTVGDAGCVLPVAEDDAAIIAAWFDAVTTLVDDPQRYAYLSARALQRAAEHLPGSLAGPVDAAFRRWVR